MELKLYCLKTLPIYYSGDINVLSASQLPINRKVLSLKYRIADPTCRNNGVIKEILLSSVFRNGDDVNRPVKVTLKRFDLWNITRAKDAIGEKVRPTGGFIHSIRTLEGQPIKHVSDLQNGSSYIVLGLHEKFQSRHYEQFCQKEIFMPLTRYRRRISHRNNTERRFTVRLRKRTKSTSQLHPYGKPQARRRTPSYKEPQPLRRSVPSGHTEKVVFNPTKNRFLQAESQHHRAPSNRHEKHHQEDARSAASREKIQQCHRQCDLKKSQSRSNLGHHNFHAEAGRSTTKLSPHSPQRYPLKSGNCIAETSTPCTSDLAINHDRVSHEKPSHSQSDFRSLHSVTNFHPQPHTAVEETSNTDISLAHSVDRLLHAIFERKPKTISSSHIQDEQVSTRELQKPFLHSTSKRSHLDVVHHEVLHQPSPDRLSPQTDGSKPSSAFKIAAQKGQPHISAAKLQPINEPVHSAVRINHPEAESEQLPSSLTKGHAGSNRDDHNQSTADSNRSKMINHPGEESEQIHSSLMKGHAGVSRDNHSSKNEFMVDINPSNVHTVASLKINASPYVTPETNRSKTSAGQPHPTRFYAADEVHTYFPLAVDPSLEYPSENVSGSISNHAHSQHYRIVPNDSATAVRLESDQQSGVVAENPLRIPMTNSSDTFDMPAGNL